MEIEVRKINDYTVEINAKEGDSQLSMGLLNLSEQRDFAEHLIQVADDLLSRNFEYKIQSDMLNVVAENL